MKRIGIITYHHALNYGTLLQAYATQRMIEKEGYNVEFINYQQRNHISVLDYAILRLKRLPLYLFGIKKYYFKLKMKNRVEDWKQGMKTFTRRQLKEGTQLYLEADDLEKNPPEYDGYIVGSDQTWNQNITNNTDVLYLSFVKDPSKKGSYAPSVGVSAVTAEQERRYRNLLTDFKYLSCREATGAKLLETILQRPVANVLDPTLMLTKSEWQEFSKAISVDKPYILTYFLGENKWYREFACKMAEKKSCAIINIPTCYRDYSDKRITRVWPDPEQYVYLIANAELVLSDSFHGTAFAINLNKNFYSFIKNAGNDVMSQSSRIIDLLTLVDLSDRLVKRNDGDEIIRTSEDEEINYDKVNKRIEIERERSRNYLVNMLHEFS